jgi:hypothetical protein
MLKYFFAITLIACSAASALDVTAQQIDGDEISGALTDFSEAGITVAGKQVAMKDIAQIKFPATVKAKHTATAVLLRNGDLLSELSILSGNDSKVKLKSDALGEFELDYKLINATVLYWPLKTIPESLDAMLKGPPPKEDLLLTVKGETITGFYEKLSDKELTFNAGGQSRNYPFDQVAAVRLAETDKFEASKDPSVIVRMADRSRITVKPSGMDGNFLKFTGQGGQAWRVDGASIAGVEISGGRLVYLSSLTPQTVEQKPYVGGTPVVFTWRKDRSAANTALTIGEKVYEKGIGVHSYCKLVYALNGEYVKFIADAGMDASAPAKAVCAWKILVDGKEATSGIAKAGGDKTTIKLDVSNAKLLELVCDYGPDDDDAGDRLDFGSARLIKP